MSTPVFEPTPPMFICGGDPMWDSDESVADIVPMVRCKACGWTGFEGAPEPDDPEEDDEEPMPTWALVSEERQALMYQANHTELACRTWARDHAPQRDSPGQGLSPKQKQALRAYRRIHESHPAATLVRRGDGARICPTCGFVP